MSDQELEDTRLIEKMQAQHALQIVHEQRITQVETRLSVAEVKMSGFDVALQKLTDIMSVQANKTTLNEAAIDAYRQRTDLFADHMEKAIDRLTDKQEGQSKDMASLKTQMNVVKGIGAALAGAGALVVVEHFFK